jgi:ribosomal protein S18 acetylase RimI-like enzyme
MTWAIRTAELTDASELPQLERSAGQRYTTIPHLAWLADGDDMSVERHRHYITQGSEWVASSENGELVGFLAAEPAQGDLHIWELAVRADVQGRGIGSALIAAATLFAIDRKLRSLTLTTFADVPWNAPWYTRLGFEVTTPDQRLAAVMQAENERGLLGRCAMRKTVQSLAIAREGVG